MNNVPHPTTIGMAFQALADTVNGVEGIKLTSAQLYMQGVLHSEGTLRSVVGNEGFFGAVGNGLKAIWEYIKKMFKAIGNFFTGSSDESGQKKVDKAIKDNDKVIVALESFNVGDFSKVKFNAPKQKTINSIAELDAFMESTSDLPVNQLIAEIHLNSEQLAEVTKELPEKPSKSQISAAVKTVMEKQPKLNSRQQEKMKQMGEKLKETYDSHEAKLKVDHSATFKGTQFEAEYTEFSKELFGRKLNVIPENFKYVNDLGDAITLQKALKKELADLESEVRWMGLKQNALTSKLNQIEGVVKKIEGRDNKDNLEKFNKDLHACKEFMTILLGVVEDISTLTTGINHFSNSVPGLFGFRITA